MGYMWEVIYPRLFKSSYFLIQYFFIFRISLQIQLTELHLKLKSSSRVQRHLLSDSAKKNVNSVIPWLNLVKIRRGDCCAVIASTFSNLKFVFNSLKRKDWIWNSFSFEIYNGIIFFDLFVMFVGQFLKVTFRLQICLASQKYHST